jgi:signal transduction histidine kinase
MLLVFALTAAVGMLILFFASRNLLLSSFSQLEIDQMKQNLDYASTALDEESRAFGKAANDYAYWDRMYDFLGYSSYRDIAREFQSGQMDGLGLNLVAVRNLSGKIVFSRAFDSRSHVYVPAPKEFLARLFTEPRMNPATIARLHGGIDAHVEDELYWRKDGSSFPVEYSSRQIRRDGKLLGAVVSFLDITHRRRQEIEVRHGQKLEAVGRLAAGIAHEINTPIQFVGDNTRFLKSSFQEQLKLIGVYQDLFAAASHGTVTGDLLHQVAAVRESTDWEFLETEIPLALEQMLEGLTRVSTIVRGMKEFSHVDHNNEKAPADLNRALESTLIVARNELKYIADVETSFADLPPAICHLGDLNQVFLNLLVNAAHALEEVVKSTGCKGKIGVSTQLDGDWVQIAISDTGVGIPEEARQRIFEPFFTTKEVGKGTGQGLVLARTIVVEKHGGTLTFDSELGRGTTFYIRLPLAGNPVRGEALVR